jgi:hypothetical protein
VRLVSGADLKRLLSQAVLDREGGDLNAVAHLKLAKDADQVALDGVPGDAEVARDLQVRLAQGHLADHLSLAPREGVQARLQRAPILRCGEQAGDPGAEDDLAGPRPLHRADEVLRRAIRVDEGADAGLQIGHDRRLVERPVEENDDATCVV